MPTIYNNDPKGVLNPVRPPASEGILEEMKAFYQTLKIEALERARAHILSRLPNDHSAALMEMIDADFPLPEIKATPQLVDSQAAVQAAAHQPGQEAADAKAKELADEPLVEVTQETHPTDLQPPPVQPPYPAGALGEKPGTAYAPTPDVSGTPADPAFQSAPEPAPEQKPEPDPSR